MDITYKMMRYYMECPMKYHLIYDHGVEREPPLKEKFDDCIHSTILYYYYSLLNDNQVTQEKLKQKWGSLWFKDKDANDLVLREEHWKWSDIRKLEFEGVSMMINFYRQNQFKKVLPIAVDYSFKIPVGEHFLVDNLELIRQVNDPLEGNIVEVVDFKTSDYKPDMFTATHDMKLTMQVYAYRKLFNVREQRILYHFLRGGKEIYSYRDEDEMKRFEATIIGVATSIENKVFYPHYSFMCSNCPLRMDCNNHKF